MDGKTPENESTELNIPDYEGPISVIAQKASDVQDSEAQKLQAQQNTLASELNSQGIGGEVKNKLLVPVIEKKLKHQRLAEHIRSEFDEPAKYPIVRENLKSQVGKVR